jgi:hypothetical protein
MQVAVVAVVVQPLVVVLEEQAVAVTAAQVVQMEHLVQPIQVAAVAVVAVIHHKAA